MADKKVNVTELVSKLRKDGTGFKKLQLILEGDRNCVTMLGNQHCCEFDHAKRPVALLTYEQVIQRLENHGKIGTADKVRKIASWPPQHKRPIGDAENMDGLLVKHRALESDRKREAELEGVGAGEGQGGEDNQ